jgi:hypothetical protein
MTTPDERALFPGEPLLHHPGRSLTAWLTDDDAVTALLGRLPRAEDDLAPLHERIGSARASLAARPAFVARDAVVEVDDRSELDAVAERPDLVAAFASLDWRVEVVDMRGVQAIQKTIRTVRLAERAAAVVEDRSRLVDFCLAQQEDPPIGTFTDNDKRGFAVSSINPNLRIAGTGVGEAPIVTPGGPVPMQALTFYLSFGNSYVNVARCGDRFLLRDGYHRVLALLQAGITDVPCIVINFDSGTDVVLPGMQTLSSDVYFGDRPPMLPDFFDAAVSDEIQQPAMRKVLRIRGDEFFVQD